MQPDTHYARSLCRVLENLVELRILAEVDPRNDSLPFRDLRQVFVPGSDVVSPIVAAIRDERDRIVHLQHEFNMYGAGAPGIVRFIALMARIKRRGIPLVVTSHAVVVPQQIDRRFLETFGMPSFPFSPRIIRLAFRIFYFVMGLLADRVTVHTEVMARQLSDLYHVPAAKLGWMPIGVDEPPGVVQDVKTASSERLRGRRFILFFGYLVPRKGLETLIAAFEVMKKSIPDAILVLGGGDLAGQEDYGKQLRALASRSPYARDIVFTSFIPEAEIDWLFANAALVALPYAVTVASGSLPLSFAMRFKRPVVATKTPPFEELNARFHFMQNAEAGSVEALASAMEFVLRDNEAAKRMSAESARAAEELSWSRVVQRMLDIYRSLGYAS